MRPVRRLTASRCWAQEVELLAHSSAGRRVMAIVREGGVIGDIPPVPGHTDALRCRGEPSRPRLPVAARRVPVLLRSSPSVSLEPGAELVVVEYRPGSRPDIGERNALRCVPDRGEAMPKDIGLEEMRRLVDEGAQIDVYDFVDGKKDRVAQPRPSSRGGGAPLHGRG